MANKQLVAASTKPLVLSILAHGRSYGYQIIKDIERLSDGELNWTDAMLYPVLHRMERDGLVKTEWIVLSNGRKRKYYSITEEGQRAKELEKQQWINVSGLLQKLWSSPPNPQPSF